MPVGEVMIDEGKLAGISISKYDKYTYSPIQFMHVAYIV